MRFIHRIGKDSFQDGVEHCNTLAGLRLFKIDHRIGATSELLDNSWILRYHTGNSARLSMGSLQKATKKRKEVRVSFDPQAFLATVGTARTITQCQKDHTIFSAGEPSEVSHN